MLTKGYCIAFMLFLPLPLRASDNMQVCVSVCVCVHALGSETRCNVRHNEDSRQACIKYTHMDARTHKLNKTSSLSALFIFTSVTNNHEDINNPRGINSTNRTHEHTHAHYKHINVTSHDYTVQQVSMCVYVCSVFHFKIHLKATWL